uniref:Mitochondrial intermediate peptidase n=1 Tax=Magallana gigas TaxID=29159 RepID=K1QKE6_MAGGI
MTFVMAPVACQGQFPFQEKNFPYNVLYWNDKEKTDSSVFDLTEQEINKDIEDGNLFFKGSDQSHKIMTYTEMQIVYSILSQKLHGKNPLEKSTTELYAEIHNQYMGVPYVEGTAPHLRIGHLNGYGARYYSYLMSRAVASTIWQQCFKEDPLDRWVTILRCS